MSESERSQLPTWRSGGMSIDALPLAPLSAAAPYSASAAPSDWQRYVSAVSRHRWLVLVVTMLGTALGALGTRFLDPRYTAKAILWIETPAGRRPADIAPDELLQAPGWVELVTSNAVLDSVVRGLHLYLHPKSPADSAMVAGFQLTDRVRPGRYRLAVDRTGRGLRLSDEDGRAIQQVRVGEAIGTSLGFEWTPPVQALTPGRTMEFELTAPYDAAQQLAGALKTRVELGSNLLRLQLKGTDPALATATLNAIAERVVTVAADLKRQKHEELAQILGGQFEHAQRTLQRAEVALKDFRVRTAGIVPGRGTGLGEDRAGAASVEARFALDDARRDRRAIEQALAVTGTSSAGAIVEALTAVPAVTRSTDLSQAIQEYTQKQAQRRAMRFKYTDQSAPVLQVTAELEMLERQVIPTLARQLAAALATRETRLVPRADSAVRDLRRLPPLALEEARLTREFASAEEMFTNIRQRYEATRLALISSLPDVRILDAAVQPRRPASSYGSLIVLLSFVTSFGLVVMGVTVLDRVDTKVRYPEQVTRQMRLTILGAVPHVSWRQGSGEDSAPVIEALRALRLRVLHAHGSQGPLLLTVTSPGIGEGKSFVSVNLAMSFAEAGYHTLLVDGDVRRGAQHWVLDLPRKPGLTDVLAGKATVEAALHQSTYTGLEFLGAGTRMNRAPELLLSPKMGELVGRLRSTYSVIIVDSPPLAAGVDPLVLATATGNLLLVVRAGTTDMKLAAAKLEDMDSLPVRAIGAVLNDVRPTGEYRYYTYSLPGYEQTDEEHPQGPNILRGRT